MRADFQNIVNNDFSEVVIENMKLKYKDTAPDMGWLVMDVMDMKELPDASFDVAIDKGNSVLSPSTALQWLISNESVYQERWMLSWYKGFPRQSIWACGPLDSQTPRSFVRAVREG
jgi:hypothetical protein